MQLPASWRKKKALHFGGQVKTKKKSARRYMVAGPVHVVGFSVEAPLYTEYSIYVRSAF